MHFRKKQLVYDKDILLNLVKCKISARKTYKNKNVSKVHGCPTRTIIFHVQWTVKFGNKSNYALTLERSYHREHVY